MVTTVKELYIPQLQRDPRVRLSGGEVEEASFHKFPFQHRGTRSFSQTLAPMEKSNNVNGQHFTLQRSQETDSPDQGSSLFRESHFHRGSGRGSTSLSGGIRKVY